MKSTDQDNLPAVPPPLHFAHNFCDFSLFWIPWHDWAGAAVLRPATARRRFGAARRADDSAGVHAMRDLHEKKRDSD
jgi:hypothetical protein